MRICDICKKTEDEWKQGFAFTFKIVNDDKFHYYCPDCVEKRLEEFSKELKENNE